MHQLFRLRMKADNIQFHFPASARAPADLRVAADKITLPFEILCDQIFQMRRHDSYSIYLLNIGRGVDYSLRDQRQAA